MKYKCSNGHDNYAPALPERCPVCGSGLLRVLSEGPASSPGGAARPPGSAGGSAMPGPFLQPAGARAARRKPVWLFVAAGLALAVVFVALLLWAILGRTDTDRQMAAVAKQYEDAVGVVILAGQKDGQPVSAPIATAWAVGEKVFVSNGHVAQPVAQALTNGLAAFIVLNKNPEKKFRIIEAVVHPKYGQKLLNVEGKDPVVPG
jgi:hypothetical protein